MTEAKQPTPTNPPEPLRVLFYVRSSTVGGSVSHQRQACLQCLREQNIAQGELLEFIDSTPVASGQPQLDALIEIAKPGDVVVVSSADRLGRQARQVYKRLYVLIHRAKKVYIANL